MYCIAGKQRVECSCLDEPDLQLPLVLPKSPSGSLPPFSKAVTTDTPSYRQQPRRPPAHPGLRARASVFPCRPSPYYPSSTSPTSPTPPNLFVLSSVRSSLLLSRLHGVVAAAATSSTPYCVPQPSSPAPSTAGSEHRKTWQRITSNSTPPAISLPLAVTTPARHNSSFTSTFTRVESPSPSFARDHEFVI